jgi:hypothetical protein
MSRYLYALKNLLTELMDRYGDMDDSVLQVKFEIEAVEAAESEHQNLLARGRDRLLGGSGRRSWEGVSSLLDSTQRPRSL